MFIDIHELERDQIVFAQQFPARRIDLGEDVSQIEPLDTEGTAELIGQDIRLQGHLRTTVELWCARCLEPVRQLVDKDFDLYYRPVKTIAREEEVEIQTPDLEVGFYHGDGLQLEDAMREQVLLSLPMKSICRIDCAGLCPQCGQNRNAGDCGCHPMKVDQRWSPLEKFRS